MQFKSLFLIASLLISSTSTYAESMAEEKLKALKVLEDYANAIACAVEISEPPLLIDYQPATEDGGEKEVTFLIEWDGDEGCSGGTGTYWKHLNFVSYTNWFGEGRYLVNSESLLDSLEHNSAEATNTAGEERFIIDNFINPRFIESVKLNDNHQLEIIAGELQDGDGNNFPSKSFKYTISLENEDYKIIKRIFVKNNTYD